MRLKAELWVKAYIRQCSVNGAYAMVLMRGDDDAGAIYIKINSLDGNARLYTPAPAGFETGDADRMWVEHKDGNPEPENNVDDYLNKIRKSDQDFWVVEVEDKDGRSFIEENIMKF